MQIWGLLCCLRGFNVPIVNSSFTSQRQADGRRWVTETHTDNLGATYTLPAYLAAVGADLNANMVIHAAALADQLVADEIAANMLAISVLGSAAAPTLVYSTLPQNIAALREAYRNATRIEAVMMGDFLSFQTDARLQTAFGLSAAQVTNLRTTKLTPAANAAAAVRAATGG